MRRGKKSVYVLDFFDVTGSVVRLGHPARDQETIIRLTIDKSAVGRDVSAIEMDAMDTQCNCACLMDEDGLAGNRPPGGKDDRRVE